MRRYETVVEDGTIYIDAPDGHLPVGDLDTVIDAVGGHAWTISYADWERERYENMDTSDAGLTVDVVDMMEAMTHTEAFVEALETHPADAPEGTDTLSPRLGLFVGKLLSNLENGLD
ncbi:hypothetical protein [Halorientalis litorea]|jgi:hypothetical protein|uniref:hypothetical protein n=1 Tax=Halorientalis litorea TaxID=2931977 RepID=UPI001FF66224|nr:hypothetical protein [Halorientalis litorea]